MSAYWTAILESPKKSILEEFSKKLDELDSVRALLAASEARVSDLEATVEHLNEKVNCAKIVRNSMVDRLGVSQEWVCPKCRRVYTFETTKRANGFPQCPECDTFCTTKHTYEMDRLKRVVNGTRTAVESARNGTSFDHARALSEIDDLLEMKDSL